MDKPIFWHCAFLSFVAGLGDKAFFLSIIFSAWCPVSGPRSVKGATSRQLLVGLGAVIALGVRAICILQGFSLNFLDCGLSLVAVLAIAMMATKVMTDYHTAESYNAGNGRRLAPVQSKPAAHDFACNMSTTGRLGAGGPAMSDFKAYVPEDFNKAAAPEIERGVGDAPRRAPAQANDDGHDHSGVRSIAEDTEGQADYGSIEFQRPRRITPGSLTLAFLIPLLAVFAMDATDKSPWALKVVGKLTGESVSGTFAGFFGTTTIAVCIGYLMERTLLEKHLLIIVAAGLWALCCILVSQTFLLLHDDYMASNGPTSQAFMQQAARITKSVFSAYTLPGQ